MDASSPLSRRGFLAAGAAALPLAKLSPAVAADPPVVKDKPTRFQIACMTLPYSAFPLERALKGIQTAGYRFVACGTSHEEEPGKGLPILPVEAPANAAKELGKKCRDLGLEPLMMFSIFHPDTAKAEELYIQRIKQASAAGIPHLLTFGNPKDGNRRPWMDLFKKLGPVAQDHNVVIVIKQHGGDTGTGEACARITREIKHDHVKVNYDAGNVMDYLNVDPLPDIRQCADEVRSFCIKDHRNFPKDQDCGPGFGEIDHYRLLHPVAFTGRDMPLCCENIFAPAVARPSKPEEVDALARRAREFLEFVVQGLQTAK